MLAIKQIKQLPHSSITQRTLSSQAIRVHFCAHLCTRKVRSVPNRIQAVTVLQTFQALNLLIKHAIIKMSQITHAEIDLLILLLQKKNVSKNLMA